MVVAGKEDEADCVSLKYHLGGPGPRLAEWGSTHRRLVPGSRVSVTRTRELGSVQVDNLVAGPALLGATRLVNKKFLSQNKFSFASCSMPRLLRNF